MRSTNRSDSEAKVGYMQMVCLVPHPPQKHGPRMASEASSPSVYVESIIMNLLLDMYQGFGPAL